MKKNAIAMDLKAANLKWLALLAVLDVLLVGVLAFPDLLANLSWSQLVAARGAIALLAPVVVLVLAELLSPQAKATLVWWKGKQALPGHAAFSKYGPADLRVNMQSLEKNVGKLPVEAAAQNTLWYKLFKMVENETTVLGANRSFLLYRDMASMSFLLVFGAPLGLMLAGATWKAAWTTAAVFAVQYLMTVVAARHGGHRLVANVLAVHAATKIQQKEGNTTRTRNRAG